MRRDVVLFELLAAIDAQLGLQLLDAAAQHANLDVGLVASAGTERGHRGAGRCAGMLGGCSG